MALKLVWPCRSKKNDTRSPSLGGKGDSGGVALDDCAAAHNRLPLPAWPRCPWTLLPPAKLKARVTFFLAVARASTSPPGTNRGRLPGLLMAVFGGNVLCDAAAFSCSCVAASTAALVRCRLSRPLYGGRTETVGCATRKPVRFPSTPSGEVRLGCWKRVNSACWC